MADSLPSPAPFKLPEDVHMLASLRDQLSDYLSTLERNTDSINDWLAARQNDIIVGHHRLVRAITHHKDEQKSRDVLSSLGDIAGFVLNLQDFAALAKEQFGDGSALAAEIEKAPRGFPAKILEDLPEIRLPGEGETVAPVGIVPAANADAAPSAGEAEEESKEKKGFWSSVGGWFKGRDPEEEAREKEEAVRRQWRNLRSELISLQSDRHYYIDSFMDWIGENLEPEDPAAHTAPLMEQYQNPQYVINLAQRDYAEVNEGKTQRLAGQSLSYSAIARTVDEQKISDFIAFLPVLFPKTETAESKQLKTLLLTDFGVASFAELALTQVSDRKDQLALLSAALTHETKFEIAGLKTGAQIFEKVLGETLSPQPLDSSALLLTLEKLKKQEKDPFALIDLSSVAKAPFKRIADRFGKDYAAAKSATEQVLRALGDSGAADKTPAHVFAFAEAADKKDSDKLARALSQTGSGHAFMALWQLAYPGKSIVAAIEKTAENKKDLSRIMDIALQAGVLDELRAESNAATGGTKNALAFLGGTVISSLSESAEDDRFSLTTARRLIAHAFANGGLAELRGALVGKSGNGGGWLENVVASAALDEEQKLQWTAALLEPFANDAVKANILNEASTLAAAPAARKALAQMEAAFTGANIRLGEDKIVTNLQKIANVWYNPEPGTLRFTVNGTGHTLMEGISPTLARETLELLQRKGGFDAEYDGIFNPANIDRIVSGPQGPKISWYRHTGDLNVTPQDLKKLHARADFLHEDDPKTGGIFSINQKSVALLQPLEDGTHLLVDKYGSVLVLEGNIRLEAQAPLLDLGGVWLNPHNASILSLNREKNSVEIRAESKEFDDFLDQAAPGEYFYAVQLPDAAALKKVEQALKSDPAIATPGGALDNLHFNLRSLGSLWYEDEGETGFRCRKYGPARKPGFINTEADLAKSIFDGLCANGALFSLRNVITHKDMIDDAYYNADKELLYLVIGQDVLHIDCDEGTAYRALKKLAADPGFAVVGANYIQNPAKPGAGIVEMPADVINLDRATLLAYNAAQEKTFVTSDSDKFHISLDRPQSHELFDRLEKDGLQDALKATRDAAWVQGLKAAFASLPPVNVKIAPAVTELAPEYLLRQALGAGKETRALPALDADFAIAAAPLKANDNFTYPRARPRPVTAKQAGSRPKR